MIGQGDRRGMGVWQLRQRLMTTLSHPPAERICDFWSGQHRPHRDSMLRQLIHTLQHTHTQHQKHVHYSDHINNYLLMQGSGTLSILTGQ